MPRVICDLPNAADKISGVKFHPLEDGGKISDEVSQEVADMFASIPGYSIDEEAKAPVKVEAAPAPTTRKASAGKKAASAPVPEVPPAPTTPPADDATPPVDPEGKPETPPAPDEVVF